MVSVDQGNSSINSPHQGARVQTQSGEDWFLHFHDKGLRSRCAFTANAMEKILGQSLEWIKKTLVKASQFFHKAVTNHEAYADLELVSGNPNFSIKMWHRYR